MTEILKEKEIKVTDEFWSVPFSRFLILPYVKSPLAEKHNDTETESTSLQMFLQDN